MIALWAAILAFLALAGAALAQPITIDNPGLYLAQARCPGGGLPYLGCPNCLAAEPQLDTHEMFWRRTDIGIYQISDAVMSPSRGQWLHTWSYWPWRLFDKGKGDGGHTIVWQEGVARITATEDFSTSGLMPLPTWGLFDQWTPQGEWRWIDPNDRARRETVTFPASGSPGFWPATWTSITADTIVSEHYDLPGMGGKLERIYLAAGLGMTYWQAYVPPGTPIPETSQAWRCPVEGIAFAGPPPEHPDWVLYDCRLWTHFVGWDGWASVRRWGWPRD